MNMNKNKNKVKTEREKRKAKPTSLKLDSASGRALLPSAKPSPAKVDVKTIVARSILTRGGSSEEFGRFGGIASSSRGTSV